MISPGPATRVFLALGATDMRKRFEGLAGLVRAQLGDEPLSGHLFVFSNAARTRVKILFWDGSGLWVCGKRLERGRFCWPTLEQGKEPGAKLRLSNAELAMLLGGLDVGLTRRRKWWRCNER
jgi:transposase